MSTTVDSFMEKLKSMTPSQKKKPVTVRRSVDKVFCNFKGNFGKYQILPFNNVVSDFPFVSLQNTREINMPRKNLAADGTETVYDAWIRLLPIEAYTIVDPASGRETTSLTEADESLLRQAYAIFEELYSELDARNNAMDPTVSSLIRRKNYTIFHGYCMNKWEGDSRSPAKSNFSALFVVTAKNFLDLVESSINDTDISCGNPNWKSLVYNRETKNRKGFFLFSVNKADGPGFTISVNHNPNAEALCSTVTIPEEDAESMQNPVETFLGWQANRDEETPAPSRRLFNKRLIEDAINYMTDQLAKIRIAKQNGGNVAEAIKLTNENVIASQNPTNTRGIPTNDPILAQMAAQQPAAEQNPMIASNPDLIRERNTDPFVTPPASRMDPVTGLPVSPAPAGGFSDDLPF